MIQNPDLRQCDLGEGQGEKPEGPQTRELNTLLVLGFWLPVLRSQIPISPLYPVPDIQIPTWAWSQHKEQQPGVSEAVHSRLGPGLGHGLSESVLVGQGLGLGAGVSKNVLRGLRLGLGAGGSESVLLGLRLGLGAGV